MKLEIFFAKNPIFTFDEVAAYQPTTSSQTSTLYNMLAYHTKRGHIIRIRRGLYYSVPKGSNPIECPLDPFLIASKMASDSILGYSTALDLFGNLHSLKNEFVFISKNHNAKPFLFRGVIYKAVSLPTGLLKSGNESFAVAEINRSGGKVLVTTLERTFVDIFDRPSLCGSWEEIWKSLESIEYLDLEKVFQYALLLGNATTNAKLGFFLETHQERLIVENDFLDALSKYRPKRPHYLERAEKGSSRLFPRWNLIVPDSIIDRKWEEPSDDI